MTLKTIISISLCIVVLVVGACTTFNKKYYTEPELFFSKALKKKPFDVVVIPGYPHYKDSMTTMVQERVHWAVYLYKNGIAKNFIFSGNAVYTPYREAEIMAMYAEQLGIPKAHIFTEIQAEHSTENLYYSHKIAKKHGFTSIALATQVVQSSFLYSINNHRFQLPTTFIPIILDSIASFEKIKPTFNQDLALDSNFISILEKESFWKRLKGTRGDKVKRLLHEDKKKASNIN